MSEKKRPPQKPDASRRDFLKNAAVGAAGAGLLGCVEATSGREIAARSDDVEPREVEPQETAAAKPDLPPPAEYDVVVVGAGVAGVYAAYRLANAKPGDLKTGADSTLASILQRQGKLKVGVFDYSGRIGGRLLSVQVPGAPTYLAEFGGFRFQRQMHIVWDTAQHLGLTDEPFGFEKNANPIYLRGKEFTYEELANGAVSRADLPYNLTDEEYQAFSTDKGGLGALGGMVSEAAIPGYSKLSKAYLKGFLAGSQSGDYSTAIEASCEYELAKQTNAVAGRQLFDWGYWALVRHVLSQEAAALLEDSGGYNEEAQTGNVPWNLDEDFYFLAEPAKDLNPGVNTAAPNSWRHIREGYDAIPKGLADGVLAANQPSSSETYNQINLNHQLIGFEKNPNGKGYVLTFTKRTPGRGEVQTAAQAAGDTDNVTVLAAAVILGLPKRALELVDQNNFFFTQSQTLDLVYGSVIPVWAIRIFMAYDTPWWREKFPNIVNGRSTTDLGVRQFYYWNVEDDYKGPALMLASYSSGSAEEYWRTIEAGQPYDDLAGALDNSSFGDPPNAVASNRGGPRPASVTMATEAHRQLFEALQMSGQDPSTFPYYAHFQNWTKDPWGAGWHSWRTGQNYTELIPKIRQPLPNEDVYLVGECYSDKPGWVWGALNTAEALVQCNVGLKWPSFLSKAGTWLGPGTKWLTGSETDPCLPLPPYIEVAGPDPSVEYTTLDSDATIAWCKGQLTS